MLSNKSLKYFPPTILLHRVHTVDNMLSFTMIFEGNFTLPRLLVSTLSTFFLLQRAINQKLLASGNYSQVVVQTHRLMRTCLCTRRDLQFQTVKPCYHIGIRLHLKDKCKDFLFLLCLVLSNIATYSLCPLLIINDFVWQISNKVSEEEKPWNSETILCFKVIMGCRQWEEKHSELISLEKKEGPCDDPLWFPAVPAPICQQTNHQRH